MPAENHVENPFEYVMERFSWLMTDLGRAVSARPRPHAEEAAPKIRSIGLSDLADSLREGLSDLGASRSDVVFLAFIYPVVGLLLFRLAFSLEMIPLMLPLISGFALLGPLAAVGCYEVSRRLEEGGPVTAATPFEVFRTPAVSKILGMGAILALIFFAWLVVAWAIYAVTLGPAPPTSIMGFFHDVFTTPAGWAMVVIGMGVGFLFAAFTYAISVISFPLLLDRDIGIGGAMRASLQAVRTNPRPLAVWGAIIAGSLMLGSIPAMAGLIFVMPVLGHASWRLYRRLVDDGQ
jgi:uncharacterized membrane protein